MSDAAQVGLGVHVGLASRSITNYPKSFEEYPVEETRYEEQSAVKKPPIH